MKRLYRAFVLVVLVLVCSAAAPAKLKRIRLKDYGSVALPHSWNVSAQNLPALENAYGPGVTCRVIMTAEDPGNSSMSILTYSPSGGKSPGQAANDISSSLRRNYPSSSPASLSELRTKEIIASTVTYKADSQTHQKVTAFIHSDTIYCLITSYKPSDEYEISRIIRLMITSWSF